LAQSLAILWISLPLIPVRTRDATHPPTGLPICSAKARCTGPFRETLLTNGLMLTLSFMRLAPPDTMTG
jgi:hypothetical protein